ncbi:hypothetical protein J4558_22670 [Leptolyngbya sp. 15MV]|nr:hypothetical protein J4558_22670 [Leptolyngbya sp. 15MV]
MNPSVVVQREWVDGMRAFLGRANVEQQLLPPGTRWYRLLINRDPKIVRDLERVRKEQAAREATERRNREFMEQRFRTQTGTQAESR